MLRVPLISNTIFRVSMYACIACISFKYMLSFTVQQLSCMGSHFLYLVDDAKKARKRRKLQSAHAKKTSDALKPETSEPDLKESSSPASMTKLDSKAKRIALHLRQKRVKKIVNKAPTEVIDADAYIPKDEKPPQPWVAGLSQDDRKRVTEGDWLNDRLLLLFRSCLSNSFLTFLVFKMSL